MVCCRYGIYVSGIDYKFCISLDHDLIVFEPPYFWNLDGDLVKFPELLNDTISNGLGYIGVNSGRIEFCVGHYSADIPNQNCYKKVADE